MDLKIFNAYSAAKGRTLRGDFTDQLHSRYTVTGLLVVLLLLASKQQYSAISCWLPQQFNGAQTNYIHQFCWINNTYYYPTEKDPDQFPHHTKYIIHYYQFILFILSGQIALFYFPSLLWKSIVSDSGSYINKLLDSVDRSKVFSHECENAEEPELPKFPLDTVNEEPTSDTLNESVISGLSHRSIEKKPLLSNQFADQFKNDFQHLRHSLDRTSSRKDSQKKQLVFDDQPTSVDMSPSQESKMDNFMKEGFFSSKKKQKKFNLKKKLSKVIIKPIRGVKNLALYYFGMKFFNLANVLFQLIFLRFVFGPGFWRYGYDYIKKVMNNEDPLWMSEQFPIVTICDYYVHQNLRRIHWNSSQCLLAINVLIEKFYVFIWLWLYILLILTFVNIISWFIEIYSATRTEFIFKYLRIREKMYENWYEKLTRPSRSFKSSSIKKNELNETMQTPPLSSVTKENVETFHLEYLGYDGLVMMHIVKAVAGDMIFIELLNGLWIEYLRKKAE